MKAKLILAFLIAIFSSTLYAQKVEKVCGEYSYVVPEDVSRERAKYIALERAKIEALEKHFGSIVSQNNSTVVRNENGRSDVSFLSFGGSEVKGEWIETIGEPKYDFEYKNDILILKVSVCGKAREITGAGIDLTAQILRNGTDARYESEEFRDGDDLYLLFKSPVDGYLAVYLIDDTETAYCLLPYMRNSEGKTEVKHDQEYIFFSTKHVERPEIPIVDEYTLTCSKSVEHNYIYIIFSPSPFTKAGDKASEQQTLPRELSYSAFQKWLAANRTKDKNMKVIVKGVTISK